MAITNHERVGKALELLKTGLGPFVGPEVKAAIAADNISMEKVRSFVEDPILGNKPIEELNFSTGYSMSRVAFAP